VEPIMIAATLTLDAAAGRTWDAVVIGAGPAGALAARQLAAASAAVLLVDRKNFPRWKVCGACLNGRALAALEAVGLGGLADRLGAIDLDTFELRLAGRGARFPLPAGKALARDRLDPALVEEAIAARADFLPGTAARVGALGTASRTVRLESHGSTSAACARVVLVASGLVSNCLDDVPAVRSRVAARSRIGAGCVVSDFPDRYGAGTIHMAVARHGYVGLVRVAGDGLNVAAAFDRGFVRDCGGPARAAAAVLDEAGLEAVPALLQADWHGTPSLTRRTRPVAGPRFFVLGDAAGYIEPFTGEGMAAAFTTARAVVAPALRGVSAWKPGLVGEWSRLHRRLVGRQATTCHVLAGAARHTWVACGLLATVAHVPALSRRIIAQLNAPFHPLEAT
jgi:flavin-dependent dehydrogenase